MHPLLPIHILSGSIALAAGFAALALRKGGSVHARAGTVFLVSMLGLAMTGGIIAAAQSEHGTVVIALFTSYLVATSWLAARNRSGAPGWPEKAGLVWGLGGLAGFLAIAAIGFSLPGGRVDSLPAPAYLPFAALVGVAVAFDIAFLMRGRLTARQRIGRHLWRMALAFLIAALSFFLGQQRVMPEWMRGSPLLYVPPLLVLVSLVYYTLRVRFAGKWQSFTPRRRRSEPRAQGA